MSHVGYDQIDIGQPNQEAFMSVNSMTNAAVARRADFQPLNDVPKTRGDVARAAGGAAIADTNPVNTALQTVVMYLPTEVLTLYVAVLAATEPSSRWTSFLAFLVSTPLIVWMVFAAKVKSENRPLPILPTTWPVWEMLAGTIAFVAWAFALPTTPFSTLAWYSPGLAGVAVTIASTLLGLLAPLFQRPLRADGSAANLKSQAKS
jgi:hypothetical protein